MEKFLKEAQLDTLITYKGLIYLMWFLIYNFILKIFVEKILEWKIEKKLVKERAEITEGIKHYYSEKLENIKVLNINENQKLKHSLDKLLSLQLQHKNEERQAIMNFLSNCNQWIFDLSRIKFDSYWLQNISDLKTKINDIQDNYLLSVNAERIKILLFIPNLEVNDCTNRMVDTIENYKNKMQALLLELLYLLKEQDSSSYEEGFIDEFGEGIMTYYGIDNSSKIEALFAHFKTANELDFNSCTQEINNFANVAKIYLTSLEFNRS